MRTFEKRVRALEGRQTGFKPPPSIVVHEHETIEEVLKRDGIVPVANQSPGLIVDRIVAPTGWQAAVRPTD